jgi:hypothetical protein
VEGFLSADALAVRILRQHSQPGRFDVQTAMPINNQGRIGAGPEESATARYYFDVQKGKPLMRNNEGAEFASPDAAVHALARSVAERRRDFVAGVFANSGWVRGDRIGVMYATSLNTSAWLTADCGRRSGGGPTSLRYGQRRVNGRSGVLTQRDTWQLISCGP